MNRPFAPFPTGTSFVAVVASIVALSACGAGNRFASNEHKSGVAIAGGQKVDAAAPARIARSTLALANNVDFFSPVTGHRSAYCTGVVLAKNLVLTAAHCAGDQMKQRFLAVFAADMPAAIKAPKRFTREVVEALKHPEFPDRVEHRVGYDIIMNDFIASPDKWLADNPGKPPSDLAILRFEGGLPEGFEPVRIATKAEESNDVVLAGFGITRTSNISDTGVLRYVSGVKAKTPEGDTAARHFIFAGTTVDVQDLQGGALARGACPGDSGGPAFIGVGGELVLSGILSLGESEKLSGGAGWAYCGGHAPGQPARDFNVYTDVRPYEAWIKDTVERIGAK